MFANCGYCFKCRGSTLCTSTWKWKEYSMMPKEDQCYTEPVLNEFKIPRVQISSPNPAPLKSPS